MPAPLADVDWEQMRLLVRQLGVHEAARQTGVNVNTIKYHSVQEGWFAHLRQPKDEIVIPASMKSSTSPTKPIVALENALAELGEKTRLGLAKGIAKGAEHVSELSGDQIVEKAPQIASLTKAAGAIHGFGQTAGQTLIQVNVGESFEGPSREV